MTKINEKIDIGKSNKKFLTIFENLGLPREESVIYVSLLEKGVLSISDISKFGKLKRTTLYPHIESLLLKNFIEKIPKGKRIHYKAKNPKEIYKYYHKKVETFSQKLEEVEKVFEEKNQKSTVRFYETKQGMRDVYTEMAKSIDNIRTFFPSEAYINIFKSKDITKFEDTLKNYGGKIFDLAQNKKELDPFLKKRKKWGGNNFTVKKLPEGFDFSVDFLISGKKTALFSMKKKTAIVIEDEEIAAFFKHVHKFFWDKL